MLSAREEWDLVARGWDAGYDWYARNIQPLTQWFCRNAATSGARVLDLACGSGQPALSLAERVGASGKIVATDLAPAMVETTRRRAREAGLANVEVLEMDAATLRFGDDSFDAVTCACGLMFSPDPVQVAREVHRVLVPGGVFAVAVWDLPWKNPFFTTGAQAIGSVLPSAPPAKDAPGPFRLSGAGELERTLRAAAFADLVVEPLEMTFQLESVEAYWRIFTQFAPGVSQRLAAQPDEARRRAQDAVRAAAAPFFEGDALRLKTTALCAVGRA
jgi:enediyne biosynthesis protein CalE5